MFQHVAFLVAGVLIGYLAGYLTRRNNPTDPTEVHQIVQDAKDAKAAVDKVKHGIETASSVLNGNAKS